ncbi:MAG: DEAD/DEAH box helicase [Xanthomonadaceae bacterium]|nr:DEAD/DEAH box helicase [Xanthomonadaceae bacterium]
MAEHVLTDTFFEQFDLHPLLQRGLADCGFTRCTPIQALSLPPALSGRDVAGQAQTGTGKTCAFLVAAMNRLLTTPALAERRSEDPRALVIAPTRELAIQIEKDARAIGRHTGLRLALIYGGVDYDKQRQLLKDGCDIIIATPGRLLDYYKQHVFSLGTVEVMVIDEADRMFDLGFIADVRYLFRRLPAREQRQVMLYSATLSYRVLELAYEHMNSPEKVIVESEHVTADRVRQHIFFPAKEEKIPLLLNLLERHGPARSIVFVNTKAAAERVSERLARHGLKVGTLSGDVPQKKRETLLGRFQRGEIEMLVATDVAARGLHIADVSHVFNYDLPQDAEDYVHRIGRTARLGAEGDAISFACDLYAMALPEIETYIGQKIPVEAVTADLLKPVPARARVTPPAGVTDDAHDDDASPPRAPRRGAATRGRGSPRPAATGPRNPARVASPVVAADVAAGGPRAAAAPSGPDHGAATAADRFEGAAPARKRRRRGGRGRAAGADAAAAPAVDAGTGSAAAAPVAATPPAEGERRRHRGGRGRREDAPSIGTAPPTPAPGAGAAASAAVPSTHAKPGFFRRIGSLFHRR